MKINAVFDALGELAEAKKRAEVAKSSTQEKS